jgi:hypothetical protein
MSTDAPSPTPAVPSPEWLQTLMHQEDARLDAGDVASLVGTHSVNTIDKLAQLTKSELDDMKLRAGTRMDVEDLVRAAADAVRAAATRAAAIAAASVSASVFAAFSGAGSRDPVQFGDADVRALHAALAADALPRDVVADKQQQRQR